MPKLYVVATPIGNLGDLTPRMRAAIEEAALIAAEDTRVTMKLLNHWDLRRPLISCHRHNEEDAAPRIVERMLAEDLTVALTCDAGTPGISDPGSLLVRACREAGIEIVPIPGPSAVVTALSISGFNAREFAFYGFLPREKKPLREKLDAIRRGGVPVAVLYESPHRVDELLERIAQAWPGCDICLCSDLTKKFERVYRGAPEAVLAELRANPASEKGEYCLVADLSALPPLAVEPVGMSAEVLMLTKMLDAEFDLDAAARAALDAGCPRNEVYRAKIRIRGLFGEE